MAGCIQNDKYVETSPTQDKASKEPPTDGNGALKNRVSYDPSMRLELNFLPEVSKTLFHTGGDLVLWSNITLPYLMLNATLWKGGLLVEKAKYMLIQVEPGKKYSFNISQNNRIAQEDYDCILEASGPYGSIFSEKRHCLALVEPENPDLQDRNPAAEEKAGRDVSSSSMISTSEYEVQSQDRNVIENSVYNSNSAAQSADKASGSSSSDKGKVSKQAKNSGMRSKDSSGQDVLPTRTSKTSKNLNTEVNRTARPNRTTLDSNKGKTQEDGIFIGSAGSNKYHRPDCRFVSKIKDKLYFKSAGEARKNGKIPCKTCNPP